MNKKVIKKVSLPYVFLIIFFILILTLVNGMNIETHEITYSKFMKEVENGKVKEIEIVPHSKSSIYTISGKLKDYKKNEYFVFNMPLTDETMVTLVEAEKTSNFVMNTKADVGTNPIVLILLEYLPTILLIGVTFFAINKVFGKQIDGRSSMDFGRSKAKLSNGGGGVTFKDVAGLDEEKEELSELIDFLKAPKKFQKMGARIPKGVLLVGPPGTGKTLLAKAVAGEANVPFYFISGSDFVELFVGVGASRVRDMFKQAKQSAPCLIFIDEIDAVGRQRGAGLGGGHDEREQTLNQLLTEMDGFGANEGIIIIAATNRPDVLDPALLRPGRFDRQVTVNLPDAKGREEILGVHAKGKTFAPNITLSTSPSSSFINFLKYSYNSLAISGFSAFIKLGLLPCEQSASNVNCEITRIFPFTSLIFIFIFPFSSSKILILHIFFTKYSTSFFVSPFFTPNNTKKPLSIFPTHFPSTSTSAYFTL